MNRKFSVGAILVMFFILSIQISCSAPEPGATRTVFNKRFIPEIKPMMTYEQMVKKIGSPGVRVGEEKEGAGQAVLYRWKGGRGTILTLRVSSDKIVGGTVLAPNGHTYSIGNDGTVSDLGK